MDDVLEHSAAGRAKYGAQVLPVLMQGCADRDPAVRQCSVYGLGCAVQHQPPGFQPHAAAVVQAILGLLSAPDARSDDNEQCFDNAVSALGKVLEFQPGAIDAQAGSLFLSHLPIKADTVEAKVVHKQLLGFIQRSDPRILGDNNANLPKIVEVFVKVGAAPALNSDCPLTGRLWQPSGSEGRQGSAAAPPSFLPTSMWQWQPGCAQLRLSAAAAALSRCWARGTSWWSRQSRRRWRRC
jgi:hypothetical protein